MRAGGSQPESDRPWAEAVNYLIKMFYVYILLSKRNGKIYKGFTTDLKRRLNEHNKKEEKSTKFGAPWLLVYYEAFSNKTDALREELFLKSGRGRERIKYLLEKTLERVNYKKV